MKDMKIYITNWEYTKIHDDVGGVTATLVFKSPMNYEDYKYLSNHQYFELHPVNHTKMKCKKCNSIITGDGRGTYISCECGAIAIDETEDYVRCIGNYDDYEIIKGE